MGHKIKFLHSLHNFGVCLLVLIFLFGKIFGCAQFLGSKVGTQKYANKIEVRNEYEKNLLKHDNWLNMHQNLYRAYVLEHKPEVSFADRVNNNLIMIRMMMIRMIMRHRRLCQCHF